MFREVLSLRQASMMPMKVLFVWRMTTTFWRSLVVSLLAQQRPLTVYDLGLNDEARTGSPSDLMSPCVRFPPLIESIRMACGDRAMARTKREWPLWTAQNLDAPYRRVAWIDADAIVLRGLQSFFDLIRLGPVITPENLAPEKTANPVELLHHLPLSRSGSNTVPDILLNAGVSGWCLERDRSLLEGYIYPIRCIFQGKSIPSDVVRWHDQGCLIWALQNAGYDSSILQNKHWNLCGKNSKLSGISTMTPRHPMTTWLPG